MCYSILLVNPYTAHGIGWLVATGCSFQLNRMWVFGYRDDVRRKFVAFILLAFSAVVISTVLLHMLHKMAALDFYLAKFIAMGMVSVMNDVVTSQFIFDRQGDS